MSALRFALSTEQSLRRQLERSLVAAERRSGSLRADAHESTAQMDLSDVVDGEANDPSAVHREESLALAAGNDHAIEEIRAALGRLDDRSYGTCERCSSEVPLVRLRALPETRWCVTCSQDVGRIARSVSLAAA